MSDGARLVRTKTGSKLHVAGKGSSRTFCGARVAMPARFVPDSATFCAACGIDPTLPASSVREFFGVEHPKAG